MNIFNYVKTKIHILDVISEYTSLKKAGSYFKGNCPLHNEKTGSFTVSPNKEIFYCFGCHAGGDVITFISKIENCSQLEAAKHLAKTYQIELPAELDKDLSTNIKEKEKYFNVCEHAANWCHEQLIQSPYVIKYLLDRGFDQKSINLYKIGYFPGGFRSIRALTSYMSRQNIILDDLLEAKIVAEGKKVTYSPFEERIMFPIKDIIGRHCGFGGRIFKNQDQRAKYYNSHENLFFNKGSLLFGFDIAKKSLNKSDHIFVVEGYTDCIAMSQYGFTNTVATLGTACTQEHLKILARYVNFIYVLYDGDKAGKNAIMRLTELCWQVNIELKVIILPDGEDPASFLHKGNSLKKLISKSRGILEFFIDTVGQNFLSKALSEKITLAKDIVKKIENIEDPLKKDILLQKASKIMQIPIDSMKSKNQANIMNANIQTQKLKPAQTQELKLEKKIFFAIINNMKLINEDNQELLHQYLPNPIKDIFLQLKTATDKDKELNFTSFFDTLDDNNRKYVSRLLLEFEDDIEEKTFEQLILQFQKKNWKYIVKKVKKELEIAKRESNDKRVEAILKRFCQLKKKMLRTS